MALADYQTLVDSLVRDQSTTLTGADRDRAIEMARLRYSADVEQELAEDITWPADGHMAPLPTGWKPGAWLIGAEYPIGQSPLASIELGIYIEPTGQKLMSAEDLPAGALVRVRFAAPHVLSGTTDSIPAEHREAVASYAAHVLCKQLAAYYSADRETSISADGSNTESRARNYSYRAKEYRAAYFSGIGKVDPQVAATGAGSGSGGGGAPAASVGAWAGRQRAGLHINGYGG
jgi:hypothetical protein